MGTAGEEIISLPSKENAELPSPHKGYGGHFAGHFEGRLDCFLCRWGRTHEGSTAEVEKTSVKCISGKEALCFTKDRIRSTKFQVISLLFPLDGNTILLA